MYNFASKNVLQVMHFILIMQYRCYMCNSNVGYHYYSSSLIYDLGDIVVLTQ